MSKVSDNSNLPNTANLSSRLINLKIRHTKGEFISNFKAGSWTVLLLCSILQIIIFPSRSALFGVSCAILIWACVTTLLLNRKALYDYPLSSFLILGFALTQSYFPILFTLIEGHSVINNLVVPDAVFLHVTLQFFVFMVAHTLYKLLSGTTSQRSNSILLKFGIFRSPTTRQLWGMGIIGLISSFIFVVVLSQGGSIIAKLLQGFEPFIYAPYFIPISELYNGKKTNRKKIVSQLAIYTALVFVLSIFKNARGAFMFGFTALAFSYLLGLFLDIFPPRLLTTRNVFIGITGLWLLTGPFSDMALAMAYVRLQRTEMSPSELFSRTLDAYQDKKLLRAYKFSTTKGQSDDDWDESYLDNVFLARFCNLKYNDQSLVGAYALKGIDADMRKLQEDKVLSLLPGPVIKFFQIEVDKKAATSQSLGDYLWSVTGGDKWSVGGFRTGNMSGTGLAAFGWWYLLILGAIIMPVFLLFDKLVISYKKITAGVTTRHICFSIAGLMYMTSIFQFMPTEGVLDPCSILLRGWVQNMALYLLMFQVSKIF